jgi:acyl-CoA-binding protein
MYEAQCFLLDTPTLSQLYGLYKRSTAGACNVRVPTMLVEPIARER